MRIAAVALISMCIIGAYAETGNCNPDGTGSCTYTLTETELVISGKGPMKDWTTSAGNTAPWNDGSCHLTKVTIEKGITNIGNYAFYKCINLTSVTVSGSTVETIGTSAFQGCTKLTSFDIPEGVKTLGNSSFSGCTTLSSVTFPTSLTTINSSVFSSTGFINFTFPRGFSEIPPNYFATCSKLKTVEIPEGIKKIGDKAFWNCNALITATIPSTVTDIAITAFGRDTQRNIMKNIFVHKCNPKYSDIDGVLFSKDKKTLILYPGYHSAVYTIPEGVTHIGPYAFDFVTNNFWQINFSSTVTHIGQNAFSNLGKDIYDLIIPENVVHIERDAFFNNGAKRIYYLGLHDPDPDETGAFFCPAGNGFGSLFLPIDYQDDMFSCRNVSLIHNSTFDIYRGQDNECYQAFYDVTIQNYKQCAQYPPVVQKAKGLIAMRPKVYDLTHKTMGCFRYKCQNQTGLEEYTYGCYSGKVCINDKCEYPRSSSSSSDNSDEPQCSDVSGQSHLDSGLRSTASYVLIALLMAFVLLI